MIDVLHLYDYQPVGLTWQELLSRSSPGYHPCTFAELCPEVLQANRFGLIIFEVCGMDTAAAAILQQLKRWLEISGLVQPPIIVLIEKGSGLSEQAARVAGADFYMVKPLNLWQMEVIVELLGVAVHPAGC